MFHKIFCISIVFVLYFQATAQDKYGIRYPHKEVSVNCNGGFPRDGLPSSCLIQTRDEFNKLCNGAISGINFNREIVVGVLFPTIYEGIIPNRTTKYQYYVMKDPKTGVIHFVINYTYNPPSSNRGLVQKLIAIQKPIGDYEINVHFVNSSDSEIIKVHKNSQ